VPRFSSITTTICWSLSLATTHMHTAHAADQTPCSKEILRLHLHQIQPTQHGLRSEEQELLRLQAYVQGMGQFPKPIAINRFEDGALYVRDGHHALEIAKRLGMGPLEPGRHFVMEQHTYDQYGRIHFGQGWITPFDPRQSLRLAQLNGYRWLINYLRGTSNDETVRRFIHAHPESYSIARSELAPDAKSAQPFEGSLRDREAYFIKMDASMPMKVGHLLPVFPSRGVIYEPGMGSGMQAAAYAAYNPHLLVVSSDLDLGAVRHAQNRFVLPNLVQLQANAMDTVFPDNTLDAMVDSSLGHHITSYGSPKFVEARIEEYRQKVFRMLKPGGRYGMRDFVVPEWPEQVELVLPTIARTGEPPYGQLSVADLFEHFCKNFRSHDFPQGVPFQTGMPFHGGAAAAASFKTYQLPREAAANFLLRVQYTAPESWPAEMQEQYTFYTAKEHIDSLRSHGFRVDYASNVRNPWIENGWWDAQQIKVRSVTGAPLDYPPTNFLLYATKPRPTDAVSLTVAEVHPQKESTWLKRVSRLEWETGQVTDLVHVPGTTHAYIPFERSDDTLFIYLLPNEEAAGARLYEQMSTLAEAHYGGFLPRALGGIKAADTTAIDGFANDLGTKAAAYLDTASAEKIQLVQSTQYFPSPGGSDERVEEYWIDMKGTAEAAVFRLGKMKRVELKQLLSAAHVGAVPDPKLETAAYRLALQYKIPLLKWFGSQLPKEASEVPAGTQLSLDVPEGDDAQAFAEVATSEQPFMRLLSTEVRLKYPDQSTRQEAREYVAPRTRSVDTALVVPYIVDKDSKVWVGLELRNFASFQMQGLAPEQAVVPAWRLEKGLTDRLQARQYLQQRMAADVGLSHGRLAALGEGYFPSIANTIERVTPYAYRVDAGSAPKGLVFVPLQAILQEIHGNRCADLHTQVGVLRLAHGLGLLD
jgi:SAM-dependent methyltransferase